MMGHEYEYFHEIVLDWFKGNKTKNEIMFETKNILDVKRLINEGYDFDCAFEMALKELNPEFSQRWEVYKENAKDTAPTIQGLCHCIAELIEGNLSVEDFIDWAAWHNKDCGETTSGVFENSSIEYFCLIFIFKHKEQLENKLFLTEVKKLILKSNMRSYGAFIILLYLLVESEYKSFYYFFKSFIEDKKTDTDLIAYLLKKYNFNLPDFKYDLSVFPYYDELIRIQKSGGRVEDFIFYVKST